MGGVLGTSRKSQQQARSQERSRGLQTPPRAEEAVAEGSQGQGEAPYQVERKNNTTSPEASRFSARRLFIFLKLDKNNN